MHRLTLALFVLLLPAAARPAGAQRPPGADTMTTAAAAESLAVIRMLDSALKRSPRDPQLWLRRGLVAWSLAERDRYGEGTIRGVDWTLLRRMADTSLRIAVQLAPRDAEIAMALGQLHIASGLITTRIQSYGLFETALEVARANQDPEQIAEAAIEVGRIYWRRYEPVSHRPYESAFTMEARVLAQNIARDTAGRHAAAWDPDSLRGNSRYTRQSVREARDSIRSHVLRPERGFAGELDYIKAEGYFREAYGAAPHSLRAFRTLGMLMAERGRWQELRALARDRLRLEPRDPWAWMTLGLASHRSGDDYTAPAAFDSALVFMTPGERGRLDRFERLLRPLDSARAVAMGDSARAALGLTYWSAVDPLWSRKEEKPRTEFLARVAYAELRWTVDEMLARGADTDRGAVYIRFGPPDVIATDEQFTKWDYDYSMLSFVFIGMPTFATSYFVNPNQVQQLLDSVPARWDNIITTRIDSIPVGIARFRAGPDAADVVMVAHPDVERIGTASDLITPVRTDAWLLRADLVPIWQDSVITARPGTRVFRERLRRGEFFFRAEASAEASRLAGRAFAPVVIGGARDPFTLSGFGMSDILFAHAVTDVASAERWDGFGVTPITTTVAGGRFALVWESYDLAARDGDAAYDVMISIRPVETGLRRIIANTLGALGNRLIERQGDRDHQVHAARGAPGDPHRPVGPRPRGIDAGIVRADGRST